MAIDVAKAINRVEELRPSQLEAKGIRVIYDEVFQNFIYSSGWDATMIKEAWLNHCDVYARMHFGEFTKDKIREFDIIIKGL